MPEVLPRQLDYGNDDGDDHHYHHYDEGPSLAGHHHDDGDGELAPPARAALGAWPGSAAEGLRAALARATPCCTATTMFLLEVLRQCCGFCGAHRPILKCRCKACKLTVVTANYLWLLLSPFYPTHLTKWTTESVGEVIASATTSTTGRTTGTGSSSATGSATGSSGTGCQIHKCY